MPDKKLTELPNVNDIRSIAAGDEMYAVIGGASSAVAFRTLSEYIHGRTGFYGVGDFGAVGDGVADDLAAIQSAIDAARANGGGIVAIPAGIYAISAPLSLKDGVSLRGVRPAPTFTQLCPDLGIALGTGTWLKPTELGLSNAIEFNTDASPAFLPWATLRVTM